MNTRNWSKQKNLELRTVIFFVVMVLMLCFLASGFVIWKAINAFELYEETDNTNLPTYSIKSLGINYEELWKITNTSATRTSNSNNLTVSHNMVYLVTEGSDENLPTTLSIVAFDKLTSNTLWQINGEFGTDLFHNSTYLYATIDRNHIVAYEPESGEQVWGTNLPGVRGISHVTATEAELFIAGVPDKFFILDAFTGRTITSSSSSGDIGYTAFLVENDTVYWHQWPLNLVSTDLQTEERNWSQSFEGGFEKTPVFTEELIFVVTFGGQLFVLDKVTGEIIWQTAPLDSLTHSERVVSNVAVADGVVYYLTQDSQLRALNMYTGELLGMVEFTPSLFTLGTDIVNYRFDVAASDDLVAVYFGGSYQIFTFRFLRDE
ncbi:MAG: PQQ-binding-like beta-propeller repeat protein [Chloroflexi bacterium]|nr:PQQ-binding-like beta-propeller repeat protein [Chloroflexota bacterium]